MFWKKKSPDQPLTLVRTVTKNLKLSRISVELYFGRYDGKNSYNASISYAENPRADYDKTGLAQTERLEAHSWPELRNAIDGLLEATEAKEKE